MSTINRQILLASRPAGEPVAENFKLVETPVAPLADGQVLVRHHFLSLDPYMRGRMSDAKSYAAPQPLDEVMIGGTAGEVVESRNPNFRPTTLSPALKCGFFDSTTSPAVPPIITSFNGCGAA